ncbi:MAG: polymer-forming cytoskeletal protein [Bryobacterales bacterium]|nr:polymer-forming cytoskeletal protein [Bryobacterales bacterium]
MWSNRQRGRDEEPTGPYTPPAVEPLRERPVAAAPTPSPSAVYASNGPAMVGKAVVVKGEIHSREDLYIDGEIQGTVELMESKLTIGPNGRIQASVRAREVVVFGNVQGNVEALEKIDIRKDARLVGDIRTARIVIEDGAYFKGSIDILKPEPKPAPKPAVAPQASPSASSTSQSSGQSAGQSSSSNSPKQASAGGDQPALQTADAARTGKP